MSNRPNLLLITTDQHRGDCIGLAGHPIVETPNIDNLVEHGAYFPRAYAEVPSTVASRRAVMAGQKPSSHGMLGYRDGVDWEPEHTLPGVLAGAGYHTQLVGNKHIYPERKLFGFHHLVLHGGVRKGQDDYSVWLQERSPDAGVWDHGVDGNSWIARPWHLPEKLHPTNWTASTAIRFLERRDPTKPFFLWLSFSRPHPPYDPPQPMFDQYIAAEIPPPAIGDWADVHKIDLPGMNPNAWRGVLPPRILHRAQAGYFGAITHIDYQIGRVLRAMRTNRILNNTFVLFASDHGEMLGDHYLFRKTYAYEGSARIPFVLRYPVGFEAEPRRVVEKVVALMDVMPTMLEAAGVEIPTTVDGRSVLGFLRGESPEWRPYLHGEHSACYHPTNAMQYLTDGKEKYIWFPPTGEEQLFDLREDPQELHDLSKDPEAQPRLTTWRDRLIKELTARGDPLTDGERLIPSGTRAASERVQ